MPNHLTKIEFIGDVEHHSCDCCGKMTPIHSLNYVTDMWRMRLERDCPKCWPRRQDYVLNRDAEIELEPGDIHG